MAKYYAWSSIRHDKGTTKHGDEVDAGKLGLNEDQFKQLVEARAVRTEKFPELPENYQRSPKEFYRSKAAAEEDTDGIFGLMTDDADVVLPTPTGLEPGNPKDK